MTKFKSLHESQKPLIHLAPESYLEYIGELIPHDHLCRMVKEVVFSLDTEPTCPNRFRRVGQTIEQSVISVRIIPGRLRDIL